MMSQPNSEWNIVIQQGAINAPISATLSFPQPYKFEDFQSYHIHDLDHEGIENYVQSSSILNKLKFFSVLYFSRNGSSSTNQSISVSDMIYLDGVLDNSNGAIIIFDLVSDEVIVPGGGIGTTKTKGKVSNEIGGGKS